MPTINLEMMKQLLEEFSEKEALTTEEINVIEQEINSLEKRIGFCRSKLQNLSADKERLTAMKERYVEGNFSQYSQAASPEIVDRSSLQTSIPSHPVSSGIKSLHSGLTSHPDILSATQDTPISEDKAAEQAAPSHTQSPTPSAANTEVTAQTAEEEGNANKEGTEPVKSINAALKGLFRK